MPKQQHYPRSSQLRRDLVSGDWIVIAPGRARRPHTAPVRARRATPKRTCPFEEPRIFASVPALYKDRSGNDWTVAVIANKYPAFAHPGSCAVTGHNGPYEVLSGVGHHDIVVTRDHVRDFPDFDAVERLEVLRAFQARYRALAGDQCVAYISMFRNHGPLAGASVYHPHYQLIATPVVPPDVNHSLTGSARYFRKVGSCVHCAMLRWELKRRRRIIFENESAVAVAPFVSREPFEVRVFPKKHAPFFEDSDEATLGAVAEALGVTLRMMRRSLNDPDYNFFFHTSPLASKRRYRHYHWHIELFPRVTVDAGFELGTGIQINQVDPDDAASMLRGA